MRVLQSMQAAFSLLLERSLLSRLLLPSHPSLEKGLWESHAFPSSRDVQRPLSLLLRRKPLQVVCRCNRNSFPRHRRVRIYSSGLLPSLLPSRLSDSPPNQARGRRMRHSPPPIGQRRHFFPTQPPASSLLLSAGSTTGTSRPSLLCWKEFRLSTTPHHASTCLHAAHVCPSLLFLSLFIGRQEGEGEAFLEGQEDYHHDVQAAFFSFFFSQPGIAPPACLPSCNGRGLNTALVGEKAGKNHNACHKGTHQHTHSTQHGEGIHIIV